MLISVVRHKNTLDPILHTLLEKNSAIFSPELRIDKGIGFTAEQNNEHPEIKINSLIKCD